MKKVIFLDVDGTLIDYQFNLIDSARKAINMARQKGNLVYLCTGCSLKEIEVYQWHLDYDGMIGGNGCYIESQGEIIKHDTLSLEDCNHFVSWCKSRGLAHRLECNSGIYLSNDYLDKAVLAMARYKRGPEATVTEEDKATMKPSWILGGNMHRDDVNKTAFVLSSYQDFLDAKEEFSHLKVGTWGGSGEKALYGDVGVAGITKKIAVEELLAHLGIDRKDAYGFGDAKSDIPMFEACGTAIAMGNAGIEAKEAADYITDDIHDDGLYHAFEHFHLI